MKNNYVLDRRSFSGKHTARDVLHPGSKLQVPVIDSENPLGNPITFAGVVEGDGDVIRVHVPVTHGGPAEFSVLWRQELATAEEASNVHKSRQVRVTA